MRRLEQPPPAAASQGTSRCADNPQLHLLAQTLRIQHLYVSGVAYLIALPRQIQVTRGCPARRQPVASETKAVRAEIDAQRRRGNMHLEV
jgi:hypothetical protein